MCDKLHLAAMSRNQGTCFGSWFKERDIFVFSALVSGHGLKNDIYIHVWRTCFGSWIKERDIFMCSALVLTVLGHGLKNQIYSCSAQVAKLSPGH